MIKLKELIDMTIANPGLYKQEKPWKKQTIKHLKIDKHTLKKKCNYN